jgi:hypothetical protein
VLSHRDVQVNRSLSHCVSQENHLEYHIISTLCTEENSKPITWAPSPLTGVHIISSPSQRERHTQLMGIFPSQGHTTFHLCLREERHTHLMGTPNSWASSPHTGAHNIPSPSQRGTTHPSHGHTQLMGSLTGLLTQSVSWRMSHAAVIINKSITIFLY